MTRNRSFWIPLLEK